MLYLCFDFKHLLVTHQRALVAESTIHTNIAKKLCYRNGKGNYDKNASFQAASLLQTVAWV